VQKRLSALVLLSGGTLVCCTPAREQVTEASVNVSASSAAASTEDATPAYERLLKALRHADTAIPPDPVGHRWTSTFNAEAVIPPMCYTNTEGRHNPCYVCHQDEIKGRPNQMNDGDLQLEYSFSDVGTKNHWSNLLEDRTERVAAISDDEIERWVAEDNYSDLAERLLAEGFKGYVPDLKDLARGKEAFDADGFAKDGSHWVAFNYKPMPSTFWPTNGATDDVMIRLPAAYRETRRGDYSKHVYQANLAILEARIKGLTGVTVPSIDEAIVGDDLNGDGRFGKVDRITRTARFVGAAREHFTSPHVYPLDTEFLHTVRYVGTDDAGNIYVPPRMKELRYMRKRFMLGPAMLSNAYREEGYDKELGRLPGYRDREQLGLDNEMGWLVSGFLENAQGRLRFNTYEENLFCMGCHTSIGSTIDNTFSFARKVDGAKGWGYIDLKGMPDVPSKGETRGEIATYLARAGGGSEFRANAEMLVRWFSGETPDPVKLARAKDVYELITPSRQRALTMNKAYRTIVADQDFIFGRDPIVTPPLNVYPAIDNNRSPKLPEKFAYKWDIRLDWSGFQVSQ
jgi:hypothetical protein